MRRCRGAPPHQILDTKRDRAALGSPAPRIQRLEFAPDHKPDDAFDRGLRNQPRAGVAPVAQHGVAVTDAEHLFKAVGHEYRRDAFGFQPQHQLEQLFHLGLRQRRGRLIHHDQLGLHRQGAGDLNHLLFGHRQQPHQRVRVAVQPDATGQRRGGIGQRAGVDEKARPRFAPNEYIVGNRHVGGEGEFLIYRHDAAFLAVLRVGQRDGFAADRDGAGIAGLRPGQDLEQG